MKKLITADNLIHQLEVILREKPTWADAEVMVVANFLILKKGSEVETIDLEKDFNDYLKNSS